MAKKPDALRGRMVSARRLIERLGGARLCYGDPVQVGDRVVIPVASVRAAGGGGFGSGTNRDADGGGGGGGGGWLEARPLGFIDAGPEGSRFETIPDPDAMLRTLKGGATALATVATTVAGLRAVRHRRAPRGLLPR
jgi:uncharacterized spore protein YtfJ